MLIRSYMRLKYVFYFAIPNLLLLGVVIFFKDNQEVLSILTIVLISLLLLNYLVMFSLRFFVYQDYILIQKYFSKKKILYTDCEMVNEKDGIIEFVFKDGSIDHYKLNGFLKVHQTQLYRDLGRKINKDFSI